MGNLGGMEGGRERRQLHRLGTPMTCVETQNKSSVGSASTRVLHKITILLNHLL